MTNENQMLAKLENLSMGDTVNSELASFMYAGDFYEPIHYYWYPSYPTYTSHKDTFAQALTSTKEMIE